MPNKNPIKNSTEHSTLNGCNSPDSLRVVHIFPEWLPITMTWLHKLIIETSTIVPSKVLCEKTYPNHLFPYDNINSFSSLPPLQRILERTLKRMGLSCSLPFFIRSIKQFTPAVIHSHFGHIGANNQQLADHCHIPHIVSFYGMDITAMPNLPGFRKKYLHMFKNVKLVLCEGPYMAKSIQALGCPEQKLKVHHLGIDLENIRFQPRNYTKGEQLKILIAASFRQKKGIPDALKALGIFSKDKDIQITIIGDASGDQRSKQEKKLILDTIQRSGLHDKVKMTGFVNQEEFNRLSTSHHIFLSPSRIADDGDCEGGTPVAIIEMAASGMMIISTTHCDIPNVIINNKTGLLAPERDVNALVEKLEWAWGHPDEWSHMLECSRAHIVENFDSRKQAIQLIDIYRSVASL